MLKGREAFLQQYERLALATMLNRCLVKALLIAGMPVSPRQGPVPQHA